MSAIDELAQYLGSAQQHAYFHDMGDLADDSMYNTGNMRLHALPISPSDASSAYTSYENGRSPQSSTYSNINSDSPSTLMDIKHEIARDCARIKQQREAS